MGEGTEPGKGLAPVCSQEIFRHAVDGRAVAYFGGGGALGGQQRAIAGFGFAPLMVGPGDVDPVPTLPLRGGDHSRTEFPGVLDGCSAVTENLSDTDLVKDDAGRAEGGEPVIGVGAEPGGGGGGLEIGRASCRERVSYHV